MNRVCRPPRARRRGVMLLEVTVAAVLLGVAMLLAARVVAGLAAAGESAGQRQWALRAAENTLERVASLPWDRLTASGGAAALAKEPSRRAAAALPGGEIAVDIDAVPGEPDARRLVVEVRWTGPADTPVRAIRLIAWSHRHPPGGEP